VSPIAASPPVQDSANRSCCSARAPAEPGSERGRLIRRAFRLEWASIAWMTIEAAVAIGSGMVARSLLLVAFGFDSLIELASACVLVWRLGVELRHGRAISETAERRASRIGAALLFALAAYIVLAAAWHLHARQGADFSWPGLVIALLAAPVMTWLARQKLAVAAALESRAMRADAVESLTCGWLSLAVASGLIANALFGRWWIDPAASLAIVGFVVKEAREAWAGDACCDGE
jgi:divalent metal cation (Fe/Co/Zn/Cd) transporter